MTSPETGWNFLQLVRLLLRVEQRLDASNDNAVLEALDRGVQFRDSLRADFPPGEIRRVEYRPGTLPARVTTVDGGLCSLRGPLPEPFIAWIRSLEDSGDSAMKDFVGLFGNRLLALRYLIGRSTRPALMDVPAERTYSGQMLQALAGRLPGARTESNWDPAWDLGAAGLFANRRLSLPVARYLLRFALGLNLVAILPLRGGWLRVDAQDDTRLGRSGATLGSGAALGRRVWDQHKGIELQIGPVRWQELRELIPGGARHAELKSIVARITDRRCDCRVTFIWPRSEVPRPVLGRAGSSNAAVLALGYTATLAAAGSPAPQAVLHTGFTLGVAD